MIHRFLSWVAHIPLPQKFTYPLHYTPHPLCVMAAEEVQAYLHTRKEWQEELNGGKMFGVLVVQESDQRIGYLAAFSGILAGQNQHSYFVPPVYDLLQPDGFFKLEEQNITALNAQIDSLTANKQYSTLTLCLQMESEAGQQALDHSKAYLKVAKASREKRRLNHPSENELADMTRESQHQKAEHKRLEQYWKHRITDLEDQVKQWETKINALKQERKQRSAALQQRLFAQFKMLNGRGEQKTLCTLFEQTVHKTPPAGAGECAAPKLLQYAYLHRMKPIAMAEFWWGNSPKAEIRHHGYYYPACKGKCEPILQHMLMGLEVEENPLCSHRNKETTLEIVFEDEWLAVVHKPAGMLSVPGKEDTDSVYRHIKLLYPNATGPMIVHRLDMATSGLLLIAKTKEIHQNLQAQFKNRTVKKRYIALLDGVLPTDKGVIDLPLCLDPLNRPRQIVSQTYGKEAITHYEIIERNEYQTRIAFYPLTGRTHQLRVHASHPLGLNHPIVGDELYGKKSNRLYLHAESIEFKHPLLGTPLRIEKEPEF